MHKIHLSQKASRDIRKLDRRYQKAIARSFSILANNPQQGKSLVGDLKGYYSYRIGKIRVVYSLNRDQRIIEVKAIGLRKEIYKRSLS